MSTQIRQSIDLKTKYRNAAHSEVRFLIRRAKVKNIYQDDREWCEPLRDQFDLIVAEAALTRHSNEFKTNEVDGEEAWLVVLESKIGDC